MSKHSATDQTLELLRLKIREQMNDLADTVAAGGCTDYASYKDLTGQITGLAVAERELLDLDERLSHD